jgi:SAM-dependent methyltransferase
MITYISSILDSKGGDTVVMKYLVFLAIIVFIYLVYQYTKLPSKTVNSEGFTQEQPFVLKINDQIYDDFYTEVYDELHCTTKNVQWTIEQIIKMTEPTILNSIFLDVGSGTGNLLNKLCKSGYKAYGIDKSKTMVDYSEKIYPDIIVKHGDAQDPMSFEQSTFTHIICSQMTIYQIKNKRIFFRNLYHWLKPNAYLILHLVDTNKFSVVSPLKDDEIQWMPFFKTESHRQTDSISEFDDFQYRQSYNWKTKSITETFIDKESNHVRQNEQVLFMDELNDILTMANENGFILHGKVDMTECNGDKHQYLYILERVM